MHRAIELARRGQGAVAPNPLVGCVVVRDGHVVGEGWHRAVGGAHAEVEALHDAGSKARGATVYVNLEPCAHHGRTPPCTDALLQADVRRVVYAVADPNPVACGGGARLRAAGIEVIAGVAEARARDLNRFFFHQVATGRPYVIAKTAASLDGRSATRLGHSQWITGAAARRRAHELRQAIDAIVIGAQTAVDDDPALTVRLDTLPDAAVRHPLRVLLDSSARVGLDRRLLRGELPGRTLVLTSSACSVAREQVLRERGIELERLPRVAASVVGCRPGGFDPLEVVARLAARGVQSVLIEGGPSVVGSFVDAGAVDEVWAFVAPMVIGGRDALPAIGGFGAATLGDATRLLRSESEWIGDDLLVRGQVETRGRQEHTCSPD